MDEKELRIGNLIKYTDYPNLKDNLLGKVICVTGDDISFMSDCNVDYLEPILLTEGILDKLKFSMKFGTDPQEPNALRVRFIGHFELLKFSCDDDIFYSSGRGRHTNVIFVHQLQNLYFALTGEELDVTNIK